MAWLARGVNMGADGASARVQNICSVPEELIAA